MARYLYSELASAIQARKNCIASNNLEWKNKWEGAIELAERNYLPSGAGIDSGTRVDLDRSHGSKLVLTFGYHHMNDVGYYDGWTEHIAYVTPAFGDINIRITGPNRNDIKDYLVDTFAIALGQRVHLQPLDAVWQARVDATERALGTLLADWANVNLPAQPNATYYTDFWSKAQAESLADSLTHDLREGGSK